MEELKTKIAEVMAGPKLASFATVDGNGNPRVRYVICVTDENFNTMFATHISSRKVEQIKTNPNIHITLRKEETMDSPYVQYFGKAEIVTDKVMLKAFWNPNLANYFKGPDDPDYCIIKSIPKSIELMASHEPEVLAF